MEMNIKEEKIMDSSFGMMAKILSTIGSSILFKPKEYLDPGTGNLVIKILLASMVGIGFAFRSFWGKLFRKITGKTEEDIGEDNKDDHEE